MPGKQGDLFDYDAELCWYREHLSTAIDVRPADRVRGVVVGQQRICTSGSADRRTTVSRWRRSAWAAAQ
jgi:hypothetical protein